MPPCMSHQLHGVSVGLELLPAAFAYIAGVFGRTDRGIENDLEPLSNHLVVLPRVVSTGNHEGGDKDTVFQRVPATITSVRGVYALVFTYMRNDLRPK